MSSTRIPALTAQAAFFQDRGTLRGVNVSTGDVLWSFTGDGSIYSAPVVIDNVVIVASNSGNVYAVDGTTGARLWTGVAGVPATRQTNIGAGEGYLVVPAGNVLTAWRH